jgi:hypothetical protein
MLVTGAVGAVVGGVAGGIYSYAKYGEVRWQNVVGGAAIGGAIGLTGGAATAYIVAGSATASTGAVLTGMGVVGASAAGGAGTAATHQVLDKVDDMALQIPNWVKNANSVVSWTQQTYEKTKNVMGLKQVQQVYSLAQQYGLKVSADFSGHPGTAWEMAHFHLGNARVHIALSVEAVKWLAEHLPK